MSTNQRELLQLQTNAEETTRENSSELIYRNQIPKTPFWVIGQNNIYFGVMGNNKITPDLENEQQVLDFIENNSWETLITIIQIIFNSLINENKPGNTKRNN